MAVRQVLQNKAIKELASVPAKSILRAVSSTRWLRDPNNLPKLKTINAANAEMDRLRNVGLTASFEKIRLLTTSEFFGDSGEFYVITTIVDGSGRLAEYKTQYFQGIKKGDFLPLGEGGLLVGFIERPRWFVDIHMVVMESDSDVRAVGKAIEEARKESKLDELLEMLKKAPVFDPLIITKVTAGIEVFLVLLSKILRENGDDHVATIHDFYLKHQAFGAGRHPAQGLQRFQDVEVAYRIELTEL